MLDVGMGYVSLDPWNAFWHGRPYILLHFWKCFIIFVEATEFTNYMHILRSVPHKHDVATLVPSWQQCDTHTWSFCSPSTQKLCKLQESTY